MTVLIMIAALSFAAHTFYAATEWKEIDSKNYAPDIKLRLKAMMLKAANDASLFTGNPTTDLKNKDFAQYVPDVDKFYENETNRLVPINFALKIANMKKQGTPDAQIKVYTAALQKKLNAAAKVK